MSPAGSIAPPGTKTSRPAEYNVVGTGGKNIASGSPGVIVLAPLPFPPLDAWTHESRLLERRHHIVDTDLEHLQPPGELCPSPARYCCLAGAVTESLKGQFTVLSSRLLLGGWERGKTSEFHKHGPVASLLLL